jgi:hypothetical protein
MVNELDIKNSLQNLIVKNNTNTSSYYLSSSITSKVVTISGASAERVPVLNINYPAIFIELDSLTDNHVEMGMSSRRDVELGFKITCVNHEETIAINNAEDVDNDMIQLTYNLHNLLRNSIKVSNTVDSCLVTGTEYITDEGTYNARSVTTLTVRKRG